MQRPEESWQKTAGGRRGRIVTITGVRCWQWEGSNKVQLYGQHDNLPDQSSQPSQPDQPSQPSEPNEPRYLLPPSSFPEPSSQRQTPTAITNYTYNTLFAREEGPSDLSGPPRPTQSRRNSSVTRNAQTSDLPDRSIERRDLDRRTTYRRDEVDKQVASTRGVPSSGNRSARNQPGSNMNTQQTSHVPLTQDEALDEFLQIPYGDYKSCEKVLLANPVIFKEEPNKLARKAIQLQKEGKAAQAQRYVQQSIILRKCSKLSEEEARAFLAGMTRREASIVRDFFRDYDTTMNLVQDWAKTEPPAPTLVRRGSGNGRLSQSFGGMNIDRQNRSGLQNLQPVDEDEARVGHSTTSNASVLEPDIRGVHETEGILDSRYYKRQDARAFFAVGRVFALLWHEAAGDVKQGYVSNAVRVGYLGEKVFSHIRRMVVVRERHGYCWCIPIHTYTQKGVSKTGLSKQDREAHTIIYMVGTKPTISREENGMMNKKPIAVNPANPEETLHPMSRLNFGRPYSVEWNVKVMNVGKVAEASKAHLEVYWQEEATGK